MKTHAIIPIFVPHAGCPHNCVFCDQKAITARTQPPSADDVTGTIERNLSMIRQNRNIKSVEIAFYGGSFTGIPMHMQTGYLEIADDYRRRGLVDGIHLSTRPDYISDEILDNLEAHHVSTIELGVQSFDPEVLRLSERGHSVEDVYRSAAMIQERGFTLGIQLMIGLPGDSHERCLDSVRQTIKIGPELARLYPTVILRDTRLYEMYEEGSYKPFSQKESVEITRDMYRALDEAGINVIRVGLKSTDIIRADGTAVTAGTFHPAFRQLVEAEIAREMLEEQLTGILQTGSCRPEGGMIEFLSNPASFSNMVGNGKSNRKYFAGKYPDLKIRFKADSTIRRGRYVARAADQIHMTEPMSVSGSPANSTV